MACRCPLGSSAGPGVGKEVCRAVFMHGGTARHRSSSQAHNCSPHSPVEKGHFSLVLGSNCCCQSHHGLASTRLVPSVPGRSIHAEQEVVCEKQPTMAGSNTNLYEILKTSKSEQHRPEGTAQGLLFLLLFQYHTLEN